MKELRAMLREVRQEIEDLRNTETRNTRSRRKKEHRIRIMRIQEICIMSMIKGKRMARAS